MITTNDRTGTKAGMWRRGEKKRESSGGGAGFAWGAQRQSVCLRFWPINFASRSAQKCWVVRWVWGLVLVRKVPISMDPYSIDKPDSNLLRKN